MPRDDQESSSAKREEPSAPIDKGVASVQDKYKSFRTRTWSTLGMLGSFVLIVYCGHVPLMFMIFTLQWAMVKELFQLARTTQQDDSLPGFRLQQWYFFGVACFYFYLRFIKNNLLTEVTAHSFTTQLLSQLIARHAFIAYSAYIADLALVPSSYGEMLGLR